MRAATPCHDTTPESEAFEVWIKLRSTWTFPLLVAFAFAMLAWSGMAMVAFTLALAWWTLTSWRASLWYRRWRRSMEA